MRTSYLSQWSARGRRLNVFGYEVFTVIEGPEDAETLLILHGFPTSSLDFASALPSLAQRFRVILHDHLGFGLSEKPARYSYSLIEQAEIALEVWRVLGVTRAHLLAHDYGTSIATELLARRERSLLPLELSSITFTNGSVHRELAQLTLSQKLLAHKRLGPLFSRLSNQYIFCRQLRRIFGSPEAVSQAELEALWEGMTQRNGLARLPKISSYLEERWRFWERWIFPLTRLNLPTHIVWGKRDPIAVPAIAERLYDEIPGAKLTWLEELGHYPMLESPQQFSAAVLSFFGAAPRVSEV
jgi:pimeloyl-ACP methyl ester carboxylesterase